jgi:hypothetical protein
MAAGSLATVEIVRVKGADRPPARAILAGAKLHDAFTGKLLHVKLTVPVYPLAGEIERA